MICLKKSNKTLLMCRLLPNSLIIAIGLSLNKYIYYFEQSYYFLFYLLQLFPPQFIFKFP